MKTVGLKALKNNLSKFVRAAAAGEVVQITDRDRVVAELRAPESRRNITMRFRKPLNSDWSGALPIAQACRLSANIPCDSR